jgi:centrosomal protein CEP76
MADAPPMSSSPLLSSERVAETRRAIHQHLQQANVYTQIRGILATYAAENADFDPTSPDAVMHVLKERGVVQQVLGSIGDVPQRSVPLGSALTSGGGSVSLSARGANQTALYVRLSGGRAFLDNFDVAVVEARRRAQEQMIVHLHFGSQRFRSVPLPVSCDPAFDDDFLINFEPSIRDIIESSTPLHVLVTSEDVHGLKCRVVGENTIEWRRVLKKGTLNVAVELAGVNPGVPAGVLDVQLEMLPFTKRFSDEEIQYHLEQTKAGQTAADREFLIYARRWWSEYHAIRPSHAQRKVKVFSQSVCGRMLPVTHYLDVVQPDRVFDGPEDAARFVALFGIDSPEQDAAADMLSGLRTGPGEQWLSTFAFLAQRRGDSPNHAALLCSLLLGFGLDAYCVHGSSTDTAVHSVNGKPQSVEAQSRVMVLTRHVAHGPTGEASYEGRIWDPCNGGNFSAIDVDSHRLATIDCAFNHRMLYANVQEHNRTDTTQFAFEEEALWKGVNPMKLRMVPRVSPSPPLLWIPVKARQLEQDLELRLQKAIIKHRDTLSATTLWDDDLPVVFNQALSKYEAAARDPLAAVDLTLFSQGIKGKLGDGRTFKGFPLNVSHSNETRIVAAIRDNATGRAILEAQFDEAYHALRCKIWLFPEGVMSVWLMLGVRYRPRMS